MTVSTSFSEQSGRFRPRTNSRRWPNSSAALTFAIRERPSILAPISSRSDSKGSTAWALNPRDPAQLAHRPVEKAGRRCDQGWRWRRFAVFSRAVDEALGDVGPGAAAVRRVAEF